MIGPGADARVLVATKPVDFRKGADSLAALIKSEYEAEPFSGVVYVFRTKRAHRPTFCIRFALRDDRLSLAPPGRSDGAGLAVPPRQGSEVHLHRRAA